MAKYTINHTCGHQVEIQLFGKYEDREKRIAYLETCECEECRKAKANSLAAAAKEKRGLSDLTGSEKQIAWANTIRENAYKALDCLIPFAQNDQAKKMIGYWKEKMDSETTAKYWIDNRFDMPTAFKNQGNDTRNRMAAQHVIRQFINLFK